MNSTTSCVRSSFDECVAAGRYLGLTSPPAEVEQERGIYDLPSPIGRFFDVLKGQMVPSIRQRLAARNKAWDDGAG